MTEQDSSVQVVSLSEKLGCIDEYWSPKIVAELNGQQVRLARLKGDFVWHKHESEDELFFVISGQLTIELGTGEKLKLGAGELAVVPRGTEHRPVCEEEVEVLLFEPKSTNNTGDIDDGFTQRATWI